MPFHTNAKMKVAVLSKSGIQSFANSKSEIITYSADDGSDGRMPRIKTAQRLGTGEMLDTKAWHFEDLDEPFAKSFPDIRMFKLVFEGEEFTKRLSLEKKASALNLYRSIFADDTIRFLVTVGETRLCPLDVELSYRVREIQAQRDEAETC